jgi:hypothetical protein
MIGIIIPDIQCGRSSLLNFGLPVIGGQRSLAFVALVLRHINKAREHNVKTQDQTNPPYSNQSYLSGEHRGLQVVRVPVGTFAGTQERLFLIRNGELQGFDLGNQGGGQN